MPGIGRESPVNNPNRPLDRNSDSKVLRAGTMCPKLSLDIREPASGIFAKPTTDIDIGG